MLLLFVLFVAASALSCDPVGRYYARDVKMYRWDHATVMLDLKDDGSAVMDLHYTSVILKLWSAQLKNDQWSVNGDKIRLNRFAEECVPGRLGDLDLCDVTPYLHLKQCTCLSNGLQCGSTSDSYPSYFFERQPTAFIE